MVTGLLFQFEIIINVFVSSFRFILIPVNVLYVYGHYFFFVIFQCDDRLQLKTEDGPCAERVKQRMMSILSLLGSYPVLKNFVRPVVLSYFSGADDNGT